MRTDVVDGMRFEAGANGFLTSKPDCLQLVRDCGLGDRLLPSSDAMRTRYVYHDRLHRLPSGPRDFFATELLTWPQKLRALCEPFVSAAPADRDETVREFGDRRLGAGVSRVFLDALCVGIYGATPDRLSMRAAFPLVAALEREHGSLLKGMLARRGAAGPRGRVDEPARGARRAVRAARGNRRCRVALVDRRPQHRSSVSGLRRQR